MDPTSRKMADCTDDEAAFYFPTVNKSQLMELIDILRFKADESKDMDFIGAVSKTVETLELLFSLAFHENPLRRAALQDLSGMWFHIDSVASDSSNENLHILNNYVEGFVNVEFLFKYKELLDRLNNGINDSGVTQLNNLMDCSNNGKVNNYAIDNSSNPDTDFRNVHSNCSKNPRKRREIEIDENTINIDNDFVIQRKSKKMATSSPVAEAIEEIIETGNKFEVLNNNDYMDTDTTNAANSPSKNNNKFNQNENGNSNKDKDAIDNNQAGPSRDSNDKNKRKNNKPDPFWIAKDQTLKWREITSQIADLILEQPTLQDSGLFIKIFPKDIEQFRKIQRFILDKNIKAHTINPRNERPLKIVIKGVPADIPTEEVKAELETKGFSVTRIAQLRRFKDKTPLPIFLCSLGKTDNLQSIYDIDNFMGFIVKVEAYKFKGTKQCYNCLGFNHSSETCYLNPKCVKCAGAHKAKDCTKPNTEKAKCGNCGGEHPANYRGCSAHPDNIANRKPIRSIRDLAEKTSRITQQQNSETNKINPSFSDKLKANLNTDNSNPNSNKNNTGNTQTNNITAMTEDLNSFFSKIKEIEKTLTNIKNICDQLQIGSIKELIGFNGSQVVTKLTAQNTH